MCIAALTEDGDFDFRLECDERLNEFCLDYPAIEAAADENSKIDLTKGGLDSPAVRSSSVMPSNGSGHDYLSRSVRQEAAEPPKCRVVQRGSWILR